jgi:hypothetical protein
MTRNPRLTRRPRVQGDAAGKLTLLLCGEHSTCAGKGGLSSGAEYSRMHAANPLKEKLFHVRLYAAPSSS